MVNAKNIKICLNMIVANEEHVILRMFKNMGHLIDAVIIDDTGSTDHTVELIEDYIKDNNLLGKVYNEKWVDFGTNRNLALNHAYDFLATRSPKIEQVALTVEEWQQYHDKIDTWYVMFMDADNTVFVVNNKTDDPIDKNNLWKIDKSKIIGDAVRCNMKQATIIYDYVFMIKYDPDRIKNWKWYEPLHEYVSTTSNWSSGFTKLEGGYIISGREGNRSKDPLKYYRDALTFEQDLITNPTNRRSIFYLAQSYRDCKRYVYAYQNYLLRSTLGPDDEEKYISLLEAAKIRSNHIDISNLPPYENEEISLNNQKMDRKGLYTLSTDLFSATHKWESLDLFMKAFELRPTRLEAPFYIMEIWRHNKRFKTAWTFVSNLINLPYTKDSMFVDETIHSWSFFDSAGVCASWAGDKVAAKMLFERALNSTSKTMGSDSRERIRKNLEFCSK